MDREARLKAIDCSRLTKLSATEWTFTKKGPEWALWVK